MPVGENTKVVFEKKIPARVDAVGLFMPEDAKADSIAGGLPEAHREVLRRMAAAGLVKGKLRQVASQLVPAGRGQQQLFVVGTGPADKLSVDVMRQCAGALYKAASAAHVKTLAVLLPKGNGIAADASAGAIAGGVLLAGFKYDEHKGSVSREKEEPPASVEVAIVSSGEEERRVKSAIDEARIVAEAQNYARTIASRPGNQINPPTLARAAQELAKEKGLKLRVLDEKQMRRSGMGGILAVGAGSNRTPPRMIVLEYAPPRGARAKPLLVVGKAITFDTGGISIKPADNMGKMVFDKCGGMAVLGLMRAAAGLKLPVRIVGILAAAENHISETAYRPGDILHMYNGVTVEVTNTDAEGRLVLGDALAWGIEQYKPSAVVDLATLTGGVIVALGKSMAGVMSNSDELVGELQRAADAAGEKIWRLPLGDEHRELLKSTPADIVNSGGREAHPLQGAAFLSHFVPRDDSLPWAHLDIAGVADTEKDLPYYAKGATGWGVRTLVEWAKSHA